MIRRAFVRAMSGAILTTLLGVKAWRLEVEDERAALLAEGWRLGVLRDDEIEELRARASDGSQFSVGGVVKRWHYEEIGGKRVQVIDEMSWDYLSVSPL